MSFNEDYSKFFDLFPFAVLNPQIALLSFLKVGNEMVKDPKKIKNAQNDLVNKLIDLSEFITKKSLGQDVSELEIKTNDRRFSNEEWSDNLFFSAVKQYYLTFADWMRNTLDDVDGIDMNLHQRANFYLNSYIDAIHPANFPMLNPDVIKKTIDKQGENLINGFNMLLEDLKNGKITTNDSEYFSVGKNLAVTPGKVIYKNSLIELIQYTPTTDSVFQVPILFIPPWINKFYILDLTIEESFVKWLVDKGFTVFMISWVNPDKRYSEFGFEDYALQGVIKSIDKIAEITKEKIVNTIGYCVGGTLITSILAALANPKCKIRPKAKIGSATLLTTLLDFDKAGDLSIFMDDNYLKMIGANLKKDGLLEGQIMFNTFSVLKANDMIWRYLINNYMLGEKPAPHSILYWNSDSVNLTKNMQTFLSKSLYKDNLLKKKEISIFGVPVDIYKIKQPIYMVSMIKDHLVPWKATYDGVKLFNNVVRFVVGGSGHVAGVINPPSRKKYSYWTNENQPQTADDWFSEAVEHAGSWWIDWLEWVKSKSGDMVAARKIDEFLYEAPGKYVNNELEDEIISPELFLITEKIKALSEE